MSLLDSFNFVVHEPSERVLEQEDHIESDIVVTLAHCRSHWNYNCRVYCLAYGLSEAEDIHLIKYYNS